MASAGIPSGDKVVTAPRKGKSINNNTAFALLSSLFFMWGFITCLNDILIPHLKNLFDLNYTKTMLIQFTFFGAYFLMSLPAGIIIGKIGYRRGIVLGLSITAFGALLFYPASLVISYSLFLFAFFILATGITILQVAANPYVTVLGKPETASSRLNLSQAFNSLGTTIAPLFGSILILGGAVFFPFNGEQNPPTKNANHDIVVGEKTIAVPAEYKDSLSILNIPRIDKSDVIWMNINGGIVKYDGREWKKYQNSEGKIDNAALGVLVEPIKDTKDEKIVVADAGKITGFRNAEAKMVQFPYILIVITLALIAMIFGIIHLPDLEPTAIGVVQGSAWAYRHLVLGAVAIFLYVGTEVSIGSFLVNFFGELRHMPPSEAGKYISFYWGGAMIGRFVGSAVQSVVKPNRVLAFNALMAMVLVALTILITGPVAMWTILCVGLFNSIMFPTIFSLSIDGLGKNTSQGSGILCMAIVGGAILPMITGFFVDHIFGRIQPAFVIAFLGYAYIFFFAWKGYKAKVKSLA